MDFGSAKIEEFRDTLRNFLRIDEAALFTSTVDVSQEVRVITLALDTAVTEQLPRVVGFPFKSFAVVAATDGNVNVNMRLGTQDTFQDRAPLRKGNALKLPFPVAKAFLDWTAQPGKTITILFFQKGDFSTNVLDLVSSGGVSISDGTAVTINQKTLAAATAGVICALDTTRKNAQFRNETGADIWLGASNVTTSATAATKGFVLRDGEIFTWKNTAALYGISTLGGVVTVMEEN